MQRLTPEQRAEHLQRRCDSPHQADPSTKKRHYSDGVRARKREKWAQKQAKRKAKAGGSAVAVENEENQNQPVPSASASDSESSDANVLVADTLLALTDVPEGTVLASAAASSSDAPSRDFVPAISWTEHGGEW